MFVIAEAVVHFHVNHFIFFIITVPGAVIIAGIRATAFTILFLLHSLMFGSSILEPDFNLEKTKQKLPNLIYIAHFYNDRNMFHQII